MARTNKKWMRIYIDGYDMSGYVRDAGTLGFTADAVADATVTDAIKNALVGQYSVQAGPINSVLDNDGTTYPAGMWSTFGTAGTPHYLAVPIGKSAEPAAGDPLFAWRLNESSFTVTEGQGFVSVSLALDTPYPGLSSFPDPYGFLAHAKAAETGANSANNTTFMGASADTTRGGIFVWQLFTASGGAGAGTVTISLDDSANGSAWAALSGATSGALVTGNTTALTVPQSGMVQLSTTATVRQYLRWQLALSVQTTATFICGFLRCN